MENRCGHIKGFTLVEILLVIVVVGVLTAIIIPRYAGQTDRAKIARTKANLQAIRAAIRLYRSNNDGARPTTISDLVDEYLEYIPLEAITQSREELTSLTGTGGWVYDSDTGIVSVNLNGNDVNGDLYTGY